MQGMPCRPGKADCTRPPAARATPAPSHPSAPAPTSPGCRRCGTRAAPPHSSPPARTAGPPPAGPRGLTRRRGRTASPRRRPAPRRAAPWRAAPARAPPAAPRGSRDPPPRAPAVVGGVHRRGRGEGHVSRAVLRAKATKTRAVARGVGGGGGGAAPHDSPTSPLLAHLVAAELHVAAHHIAVALNAVRLGEADERRAQADAGLERPGVVRGAQRKKGVTHGCGRRLGAVRHGGAWADDQVRAAVGGGGSGGGGGAAAVGPWAWACGSRC